MATFNPATGAPVSRSVPSHGLKGALKVAQVSTAVTTALTTSDIINFFYLPAGATIRQAVLKASVLLDSGSVALLFDVGWASNTANIFSASIAGQGASLALLQDSVPVWASLGHQFTADTLIFATVNTAAATAVAGSLTLTIYYTVDGLAS